MPNTDIDSQARRVFLDLLDHPPQDRPAKLDALCAEDDTLRRAVRGLLSAHDDACGFLERPVLLETRTATSPASTADEPERNAPDGDGLVGCRIGQYEIRRRIGAGGMGSVYEARQEQPRRSVALKLIQPVSASPQSLRRFTREAEVLGQLHHPGIAQIYEAGVARIIPPDAEADGDRRSVALHAEPVPFIAMELIRGLSIDRYVRENQLPLRKRVELVALLCDAVDYAHARGVIHRDLKPANILIDEFGQPRVLDFGVARLTQSGAPVTMQTEVGQLVGTLAYMSPEQVDARPGDLDPRSDVYALGVLLYELIAGRPPYRLPQHSLPEAARIIRDDEPSRLGSLDSRFRGDIETIAARALEKDRARRYVSAGELSADLRRYLDDKPIVARPASAFYHFRKFTRRNKALVAGLCGTMLALLAGMIFSAHFALRAAQQRSVAESKTAEAERLAYNASIAAAVAAYDDGDLTAARLNVAAAPAALRGWEWEFVNWASRPVLATVRNPAPIAHVHVSHDESLLAVIGNDNSVTLWEITPPDPRSTTTANAPFGRIWRRLVSPATLEPTLCRITRDRRLLMLCETGFGACVWDLEAGKRLWGVDHKVFGDFSPDGTLVVMPAGQYGVGGIHDARTGELHRKLVGVRTGGANNLAAFHPDGTRVRIDSVIYDLRSGAQLAYFGQPYQIALNSDWSRLARIYPDFKIEAIPTRAILNSATWMDPWWPEFPVWSPDDMTIFATSAPGLTKVFDTNLAHVGTLRLPGLHQRIGDGTLLISWTRDGDIELRETFASGVYHLEQPPKFIGCSSAISADCRRVAIGDWGHVRMHSAASGEVLWCVPRPRAMHAAVAFADDGGRIAVGDSVMHVSVLSAHNGVELSQAMVGFVPRAILWLAASTEANAPACIVVGGSGGQLRRMSADDPAGQLLTIGQHESPINALALSRDRRILASGSGDGVVIPDVGAHSTRRNDNTIRLWNTRTWECDRVIVVPAAVTSLAFSPDGRSLAAGLASDRVQVFDLSGGEATASWTGAGDVRALAYHPSGDRLAAFSGATLRLWDTADRVEVATIPVPQTRMHAAAFAPDGSSLIASGRTTSVMRLDTRRSAANPAKWFELNWAYHRVMDNRRAINADIEPSLATDPALPESVRQAAQRTIRTTGDQLGYLVSDAILNIRERHTDGPEALVKALRRLEIAREMDTSVTLTYAIALFHAGRLAEAIREARCSIELREADGAAPSPGAFALLSLAHAKLGELDASRAALERMSELGADDKLPLEEIELVELASSGDSEPAP